MQITGHPFSPTASAEVPELAERFFFWRGASGRNYIHSVYAPNACPPLPGAVYVGVKRHGDLRLALKAGCFSPYGDIPDLSGCNEVHVHLMARGADDARRIAGDLAQALGTVPLTHGVPQDHSLPMAA